MNSFGLGLVLSFTDNASSGMNRASNTFREMSGLADQLIDTSNSAMYSIQSLASAGIGLSIVGDQIASVGGAIYSVFNNIIDYVTGVGTSLLGTRMTLNALFKSAEEGDKAFQWAKEFAATSVFNFEDLLPAMTTMKAVGIDVRDEIEATSGATQNLLEIASDLAAVFPHMRNPYGTGVQAAMGALKEYIAEGNEISLKRGAGLDITQLIGEDKGKTIEERTRQVADLIDMMGIMGMTAQYAGTPMQRLANMSDVLFNTVTEIAESGVFDKFSEFIEIISEYLFAIPDEELSSIALTIADSLVILMSPLEHLINAGIAVADWLRDLNRERPELVKLIVVLTSFAGVALLVTGYAMKFAGSIFLLTSALAQMNLFTAGGTSLIGIFSKAMTAFMAYIIPLVATAGLFFITWQKNLFGIRDLVTGVFREIGTLVRLTYDAFTDNTLSEEDWLEARDLGILPFIEAILLLRFYWGYFVDGFVSGFNTVFDKLNEFSERFAPISISIYDLSNRVAELFSNLTGVEVADNWVNFGEVLGTIVGALVVAIPLIKITSAVISVLGGVIPIIKTVALFLAGINPIVWVVIASLGALYFAWDNNFLGLRDLTDSFVQYLREVDWSNVWDGMLETFNEVAVLLPLVIEQALGLITPILESMGSLFSSVFGIFQSEDLHLAITNIFQLLMPLFSNLQDIIVSVLPLIAFYFEYVQTVVVGVIDAIETHIVPIISALVERVAWFVALVVTWISMLVSAVKPIIQNLVDWVMTIWDGWLGTLVTEVIGFVARVIELLGVIAIRVYDYLIVPFLYVATFLVGVLLPVITAVVNTIVDVFMIVFNVIGGIVTGIVQILNGVLDFLIGVFTGDWERVWEGVKNIFSGIWTTIESVIVLAVNAIILAVNTVIRGLNLIKIPDWVPGLGGKGINIEEIAYLSNSSSDEKQAKVEPVKETIERTEVPEIVGISSADIIADSIGGSFNVEDYVVPMMIEVPTEGGGFESITFTPEILNPYAEQVNAPVTPEIPVPPTLNINSGADSMFTSTVSSDGQMRTETREIINEYDYSVTFENGSIIIQADGMTDEEKEKIAEQILSYAERRQELLGMAKRKRD